MISHLFVKAKPVFPASLGSKKCVPKVGKCIYVSICQYMYNVPCMMYVLCIMYTYIYIMLINDYNMLDIDVKKKSGCSRLSYGKIYKKLCKKKYKPK